MTSRGLRIAPDLELPLDAVTETFAILAKRGSGKTYTAAVMAEEMLEAGLPVCVVDPLGVWWGLRSSADGKGDGYPVYVFGGDHGDVKLEETAGTLIADVVIDQRIPVVLDLSLLPKAAMRRFMNDFLTRLYHRNRDPLHLIIDEADLFAPQSAEQRRGPNQGDGNTLLGAMEDLVRRGRARGIGATLITQRPAVIHKDVLSQAEVLIALRMTGVRDVNAIDEWVKLHDADDQAKEVKHSLPALPIGTAWVWSPGWLGVLQRVAVRKRRTFDSSATPKMGERRVEPKRRADVDLEQLGEQIAATVERAKNDDPKELRRRITVLERELAAERDKPAPEPVEVPVEVPVLDEQLAIRLATTLTDLHKHGEEVSATATDMLERLTRWQPPATSSPIGRSQPDSTTKAPVTGRPSGNRGPTAAAHPPAANPSARAPRERRPTGDGSEPPLKKGARRMVDVLARFHPRLLTREQLSTLATVTRGGTFSQYLSSLGTAGLVTLDGQKVQLTEAGLTLAGDAADHGPVGTTEIISAFQAKLKLGARRMLDVLVAAHPDGYTRDQLSEITNVTRGGTFSQYLSSLRTNGLAVERDDVVYASETLFMGDA